MQDHQGPDLLDSPAKPAATAERPNRPHNADPASAEGGGVNLAHDFSNFAMTIVSAANLLQRFSHDPERVAEIARLLRETGERAIATSRRLRP
jgi:ribosomal protein L2